MSAATTTRKAPTMTLRKLAAAMHAAVVADDDIRANAIGAQVTAMLGTHNWEALYGAGWTIVGFRVNHA